MCGHPDDDDGDGDGPRPSRRRQHLPEGHHSRAQRSANPRRRRHRSGAQSGAQSQPPREVPSLADLGFETRLERQVQWGDAGTHSLYVIKEAGKLPHVARLSVVDGAPAAGADAATLFVGFIATESDSRGEAARPRARDVLASFWADTGRALGALRRVYFESVAEGRTREVVRDVVCPLLGVPFDRRTGGPRGDIVLRPPPPQQQQQQQQQDGGGGAEAEAEAWRQLCGGSRLVRSAMGMPRRFPMAAPGEDLAVVQIDINEGFDAHGNPSAFDLEVTFGSR